MSNEYLDVLQELNLLKVSHKLLELELAYQEGILQQVRGLETKWRDETGRYNQFITECANELSAALGQERLETVEHKMQRTTCTVCGDPLVDGLCANKSCAKFVPLI